MASHTLESYLAGSIMLLVGLLLILYLLGQVSSQSILPLFLIGIGLIFSTMSIAKSSSPSQHGLPSKVILGYGVLAIVVGVLWMALTVQLIVAEFVLAGILILFGVIFLIYSVRRQPASHRNSGKR